MSICSGKWRWWKVLFGCKKPDPVPGVWVTVCNTYQDMPPDRARIANEYCPATHPAQYRQNAQPSQVCVAHEKPAPPPYIPKKVKYPWDETGILNCWVGLLYSDLTWDGISKEQLNEYDDALADDGVTVKRAFGWWTDLPVSPWKYILPWNADWSWNEAYWDRAISRIKSWSDRGGWYIVDVLDACSLYEGESWETNPLKAIATRPADCFYDTPARDKIIGYAQELVRRAQGLKVIFSLRNEGNQIVGFDGLRDYDNAMIIALKNVGVPVNRMHTCFYDSGMFGYDTMFVELEGKGLAATHLVNSEKAANWWKDSPGKQDLMRIGDYPCSDGPDMYVQEDPPEYLAEGLYWEFLRVNNPQGYKASRRMSNVQMKYTCNLMRSLGYPRAEILSAALFQYDTGIPYLGDNNSIGHLERLAIAEGFGLSL